MLKGYFIYPLKMIVEDKGGKTHNRCFINKYLQNEYIKEGGSHIAEASNAKLKSSDFLL